MSGLAGIRTSSRSPLINADPVDEPSPASDGRQCEEGAGDVSPREDVCVDALLDHTWHYQCVVSPTFSAAALAAALNLKHITDRSCMNNYSDSDSKSSPSEIAAVGHLEQYPSLRKLNLEPVMDALIHSASNQDGYVSLASLIINRPSSSPFPTADHAHQSSPPHHQYHIMGLFLDHLFNFTRKQNTKWTTSSTAFTSTSCRGSVRRSSTSSRHGAAAADSARLINGLYAS
ncbi:hypothetical protein L7F22_023270 [Adiantum nelumboides]|nr:hypothetical protein [Adiantum nelumboides]